MDLTALEQRKLEISHKLSLFIGKPQYSDLVDKLSNQLDVINKEIELSKQIQGSLDIKQQLDEMKAKTINDSTLNSLYQTVNEGIEKVNHLKSLDLPYNNTLKVLKNNIKKMSEREEIAKKIYDDLELRRPHEITLFMQQMKTIESAMQEQVIQTKRETVQLTNKEIDGLNSSSIDATFELFGNVEGGQDE